ncbi:DNA-directed RNA polymerase subunit H [Candidatus Woesearchaeota archaeon]|nr:DNA-directed RNA polymerase subunit H [Candidatus Woesearchaeota archaeon]
MTFEVNKHNLVPKHSKVSDSEKAKLLEKYGIAVKELPKIHNSDPAIVKLNLKMGDVVKIERESKTAGTAVYYRVVIDG